MTKSPMTPTGILTKPGVTRDGAPVEAYERERVRSGQWRLELIPAETLGVERPLEVYRTARTGSKVVPWAHEDGDTYCPQHWADVKIGPGACGLRCRSCFLILTHRVKANPARHVLYDNVGSIQDGVARWLRRPNT